jgi:hypothetical protein
LTRLTEASGPVSVGVTSAAFVPAAFVPSESPLFLFCVSTTAEIGFEVGLLVASTLPGNSLRSATSLVVLFVATLFGTGRAAVGFTVTVARGAGASGAVITGATLADP